jgi:hypothetical protein
MNSKFFTNIRPFHYYSNNLILRTYIKNNFGLNNVLLGFRINKNNNLDTLNRNDLITLDNNFKINKNFSKIIDINKDNLCFPPDNFKWFYKNSFYLQFYYDYQRDLNGRLFRIEPDRKLIIQNILNIRNSKN